jgi:hypothetical protein
LQLAIPFVGFKSFSSYASPFCSKPFVVLLQVFYVLLLQGGFKGDSTPSQFFDHFGLDYVSSFKALFALCICLFDLFYVSELSIFMQEGLKNFDRFILFSATCK